MPFYIQNPRPQGKLYAKAKQLNVEPLEFLRQGTDEEKHQSLACNHLDYHPQINYYRSRSFWWRAGSSF